MPALAGEARQGAEPVFVGRRTTVPLSPNVVFSWWLMTSSAENFLLKTHTSAYTWKHQPVHHHKTAGHMYSAWYGAPQTCVKPSPTLHVCQG